MAFGEKEVIVLGSRVILAFALLRSAFAHLGNQYAFLGSVYGYEILTPQLGQLVSEFLPFWNLTLGVALLVGFELRVTFLACALTFLVFVTAQISVVARGLDVPCGCFGLASTTNIGAKTISIATACFTISVLGMVAAIRTQKAKCAKVVP